MARSDLSQIWHKTKLKPLETKSLAVSLTSQEGFEPPTVRLEGGCSILLSYYDNSCNTTKLIIMEVVLESQSEI